MDLPGVLAGSSEHFNYYVREEDDSFCEDLLEVMEQHFTVIHDHLGFEWPSGQKINYYKFLDLDDYQNSTDRDYWANAQNIDGNPSVLSPEVFHQHELIHAYLYPTGLSISLLTEGIAETFTKGGECLIGEITRNDTFEEAFNNKDRVLYYLGCRWAGFLLNTWNTDKVLHLYASLGHDASLDETNEKFEEVLGVSAEETWKMMIEDNGTTHLIVPVWNCNAPEIVVDGTEQLISADCRIPYFARTFVLEHDGLISVNPDIASSWLYRCDSAPSPIVVTPTLSIQGNLYLLKAGTYIIEPQWAKLPNTTDESPTMIFLGERIPSNWMGNSCAAISEAIPYERGFRLSLSADLGVTYIKVNLTGDPDPSEPSDLTDADVYLNEINGGIGMSAALCSTCEADAAQCLPLSFGETDTFPSGEYFLRIQIEETLPEYYGLSLLIQ